jgi:hypothetical protein
VGAAAAAFGVGLFLGDIGPDDDLSVTGVLFILGGAVLVVGAAWFGRAFGEPPEEEPGASTFTRPGQDSAGSTQPSGPPPGPAG